MNPGLPPGISTGPRTRRSPFTSMKNTVQASLITTFRCNAKCKMCDIWRHPTRPDEELDLSYYEKLPPGLRINITGGEPTLRKDIDDIFRILYPKAALLELSTNGYHTDKIVALAKKYPNILIRVSVEGLPALNDAKRGIPDGFDHALRTILELKKTKCRNIGFSVVISPDNYTDLIHLYDLCVALDVELGNSVVHNSWYFHKEDNAISGAAALEQHERFVEALLTSRRRRLKDRLKDYGRAYFNRSIHRRLRGDEPGYRPPCGALTDFFFIDPAGNVAPCNGSAEEWIIGNIKEDSLENILASEKAREIAQRVRECPRNCAFIVTERHDMVRRPWVPLLWILKNKFRLWRGQRLSFD